MAEFQKAINIEVTVYGPGELPPGSTPSDPGVIIDTVNDYLETHKDSLVGPKGDKGDTGETGPKGDTGDRGEAGQKGDKGDKGDPFTYEDFTPEQLEALRGPKGDKGDPGTGGTGGATDVRINGTSITTDGVADIPIASASRYGAVKVDGALIPHSTNPVQNKAVVSAINSRVALVAGKGLSSNDYTNEDKAKVDAIPDDLDESLSTINAGLSELDNSKIGYARLQNNTLEFYDSPEMNNLIGAVSGYITSTPSTPAQNYLTKTQADGYYAKLDDFGELEGRVSTLENNPSGGSGVVRMSNLLKCGQIFEKPKGYEYVGWPFYCVQYDKDTNEVVFVINAGHVHGENQNYDLFIGRMNLNTYEVTVSEFLKHDVVGYGCYCCGFNIANDGTYRAILTNANKMYTSTNHGETWSVTDISITDAFGLQQLSNGYFICYNNENGIVYYSEDNCSSWAESVGSNGGKYERCIIELEDGNLVSIGRKTWQGTNNGVWNGTKIIEPAIIQYSADYGKNWSQAFESTTITEMTACNACGFYHKEERCIELFVTSRYPHGDSIGVMYQYIATLDDAMNDNWGSPKVVLYPTAKVAQDYGYVGGCVDSDGDMHIMCYDGDSDRSGYCNYRYIKASRKQAIIPVTSNLASKFIPYSGSTVDSLLASLKAELISKINNIVLENGGTVDDETYYTTDGLVFDFDLTNADRYNVSESKLTDTFGNVATAVYNEDGTAITGDVSIEATIFDPKFTDKTHFSLEFVIDSKNPKYMANKAIAETYLYRYGFDYLLTRQIPYNYTSASNADASGTRVSIQDWTGASFVNGSQGSVLYNSLGITTINVLYVSDGTIKLYKDGTLLHTISPASDFASWNSLISRGIKVHHDSSSWNVKAFRIYSKVLTDDEIVKNYEYNATKF